MNCRHCRKQLEHTFVDLGFAPPSNAYLTQADLQNPEKYYPLKVKVCDQCWLVQTEDYAQANELFSPDYAYFASTSESWLGHAKRYAEKMIRELALGPRSFVIEVASNDGYLLKNFVAARIPCLGIEPTASTAQAAEKLDVPVIREFFGEILAQRLAAEDRRADLIVGNNVYAHVPDINDFTRGLKAALKPNGTITLEFPHLMRLLEQAQFDTIYHEHFSYLSLYAVSRIFSSMDLRIYNVEELSTHGGSLRVYGCHADDPRHASQAVKDVLTKEESSGLQNLKCYMSFQKRADKIKNDFLAFLLEQKRCGKKVVAYGAAAKGNTLLNYAGIKRDLLPLVGDAAPSKQGKYLPGSHISIVAPDVVRSGAPDVVIVLPWNISVEVCSQLKDLTVRGVQFVVAMPELKIL